MSAMRITGGSAKGRILKVPTTGSVRPTSDKVRQALFNMLLHSSWAAQAGFELDGAHVMDGFCGTGSLGLEALSRGAQSCVFVDFDGRVLQSSKANVKACGFDDQARFMMKGVHAIGVCPAEMPKRNLVLLDPPYNKDLISPALNALVAGDWLSIDALVIAESEKGWNGVLPTHLNPVHVRTSGDTALNIWHYVGIEQKEESQIHDMD